jgi:aminoglycoside 3-N-acetyltransferase
LTILPGLVPFAVPAEQVTMRAMRSVGLPDLTRGIRELGLSRRPVCVHASLRSFGHVAGGADAVVDAFLSEECTVLVPAFSLMFLVAPPEDMRPPRNGLDYDRPLDVEPDGRIFTPATNEMEGPYMGAVARAVVARPGRARGEQPLNSFAAVGPEAGALLAAQQPLDVYAPLKELAERGGFVLLIGVGLTSMTLLHLAEARAGRETFRRWARARTGEVIEVQAGSCSAGFDAFEPVLAPHAREATVGESRWRAYPARAAVESAARAIRANPQLTRCGNERCERCPDAIAGGPILAARSGRSGDGDPAGLRVLARRVTKTFRGLTARAG